jgi:hypothetical protein
LRGFRCPADVTLSGDHGYGPGNYVSNHLLLRQRLKLDTLVSRGTTNVLLFAEKYAACSYWALTEGEQTPWYLADANSGFQVRPSVCDPALPQTPHRAGIQVGMADASVRTISRHTGPREWFGLHGTCPPGDGKP